MAYLDDYEEEKRGFPIKRVAIIGAIVIAVGIIGFFVINVLNTNGDDGPQDADDTTTAVVIGGDEQGVETTTDIPGSEDTTEPEVTETEVAIETPAEDAGGGAEGPASVAEEYDKPEYRSSAIPLEEKMKMVEGNSIDDSVEEKYAQYGALNLDEMRDVATRWTNEWTAMINDGQWDRHSAVLKSMMDIDYVNNHSTELDVQWLYECLHDTLYVSSESMLFRDIKEVRVINSVPSPLTYMAIEVNVTYQSVDGSSDGTVIYKMALNRDYQVSKFSVSY